MQHLTAIAMLSDTINLDTLNHLSAYELSSNLPEQLYFASFCLELALLCFVFDVVVMKRKVVLVREQVH